MKAILGTAQLGLDYGINNKLGKPSKQDALKILEIAQKSGIKALDTAAGYGDAHEIIGEYHKEHPPFEVYSKFSLETNSNISSQVDSILNSLQIEILQGLYFHRFDDFLNYTDIGEIKNLKKKVNHLGVSIYSNEEFEKVNDADYISLVQIPFNIFDSNKEKMEMISVAKSRGKIVIARSLFMQGLFFIEPENVPQKLSSLQNPLSELALIREKNNLSIEDIVFGFINSFPMIDYYLFGVESLGQLTGNLSSLNKLLPPSIIDQLMAIKIPDKSLLNITNWSL